MGSKFTVLWTDQAVNNLENIIESISNKWTEKEVANFKRSLTKHIEIIQRFPAVFPQSETVPRLRKAVMSKQTSIFYEVKGDIIYLAYLFDNRKDPDKIK